MNRKMSKPNDVLIHPPRSPRGQKGISMSRYKVTACWYETVVVDADSEDGAVDAAYKELASEISRIGTVDDYDVVELDDDDSIK